METGSGSTAPESAEVSAGELFRIAALLVGDHEEAVALVEEALAQVDSGLCSGAESIGHKIAPIIVGLAMRRTAQIDPDAVMPPSPAAEAAAGCFETADLHAAGLSADQLQSWMEERLGSPDESAGKLRHFLERLRPMERMIFVLRAVLNEDAVRIAEILRQSEAPAAAEWTERSVRTEYRHALCLLAGALAGALPLPDYAEPQSRRPGSVFQAH